MMTHSMAVEILSAADGALQQLNSGAESAIFNGKKFSSVHELRAEFLSIMNMLEEQQCEDDQRLRDWIAELERKMQWAEKTFVAPAPDPDPAASSGMTM